MSQAEAIQASNPNKRKVLTIERVREVLNYDPETGAFTRRAKTGRKGRIGAVVGGFKHHGYVEIAIDGVRIYAHRIAWAYMTGQWPLSRIDHWDRDPSNNRWSNLRLATQSQNCANTGLRKRNKSGVKGVYFNKKIQKWHAQIGHSGRQVHLGYFDDLGEAAEARSMADRQLHGEFARTA